MADLAAADGQEGKAVKVFMHIPPRVDAESYQAEISDTYKFDKTNEGTGCS